MKTRVSQPTFELIVNIGNYLDKTYCTNDIVTPGYQYLIKEFDFSNWIETGKWVKVEIDVIVSPISGNYDAYWINKKYKFFRVKVVELFP